MLSLAANSTYYELRQRRDHPANGSVLQLFFCFDTRAYGNKGASLLRLQSGFGESKALCKVQPGGDLYSPLERSRTSLCCYLLVNNLVRQ